MGLHPLVLGATGVTPGVLGVGIHKVLENQTQGLLQARNVLFHLSHIPDPLVSQC